MVLLQARDQRLGPFGTCVSLVIAQHLLSLFEKKIVARIRSDFLCNVLSVCSSGMFGISFCLPRTDIKRRRFSYYY